MKKIQMKVNIVATFCLLMEVFLCGNLSYAQDLSLRVPSFFSFRNSENKSRASLAESQIEDIYNPVKCIVVDCDGLLWDGVIGEDGIDGIRLDHDRLLLQQKLKEYKERGIILAINSKNNLEDVEEVLLKHSDMILKIGDFAVIKANWQDKAKNLEEIARELNIGLDSLFFIDDNPREIRLARQLLSKRQSPLVMPGIRGAVDIRRIIDTLDRVIRQEAVTEEDERRTELYAAKRQRDELKIQAISMEDFYRSLNMRVFIREGKENEQDIPRIAQLANRTNQFNLTGHRYSEDEIKAFLNNPEYKILTLKYKDTYGENGLVGFIILHKIDNESWEINTFCLSCRVVGLTIEQAFISYVIDELKEENIRYLIGIYIPTRKNILVENLYQNLGFEKFKEESGIIYSRKDLKTSELETVKWITTLGRSRIKTAYATCNGLDRIIEELKRKGAYIVEVVQTGFDSSDDEHWYGRGGGGTAYYDINYIPLRNFSDLELIRKCSYSKLVPVIFLDTEVQKNPLGFKQALTELRVNQNYIPIVLLLTNTRDSIFGIANLNNISLEGINIRTPDQFGLPGEFYIDVYGEANLSELLDYSSLTLTTANDNTMSCILFTDAICEVSSDLRKIRDKL